MKLFAPRRCASLFALVLCLGAATRADAVSRTCGADPVANTTNVLCASGTCTATLVRVTTAIEVTGSGCEFDLGGRALSLEKNFQMNGQGFIKIENVGNVTVTSTGRLKARGDFVLQNGNIVQGGLITVTSSGVIDIAGQIDVTGDSAGFINLVSNGDTIIENNAQIIGNGISSFPDLGMLFTDGGEIDVFSNAGNVLVNGDITLAGANQGTGGIVDLTAALNITISAPIDVSGGGGDGGEFDADAGDDVLINATIDGDSSVGGGSGGTISLESGDDVLGGAVTGGRVLVTGASFLLRGSSTDQFAGDGGEIDVLSFGDTKFTGAGMVIHIDAATNFDGDGGDISLDSGDLGFFTLGPQDGDIVFDGIVTSQSGNAGGTGGTLDFSAGRDLTITATITAGGFDGGGEVDLEAGRTITSNGVITVAGTAASSDGGFLDFEAGIASDANNLGNLIVQKNLLAAGGTTNGTRQSISLAGCGLSVSPSVKIDGSAGTLNGTNGGAAFDMIARRPMQLGNNSTYLAGPGGTITTVHPNGANPVIGNGVTFNLPRVDSVVAPGSSGPYPNCPVCGDGIRQFGEVCDKGAAADGACCNTTCNQYLCVTPTPTPTRTATPTVTLTSTPTVTVTQTTTPAPASTTTATSTATPVATATATAVATSTATSTPITTATVTATTTPTRTATSTPVPTVTATAAPVTTASATPGASTTATSTPQPTATTTVTGTATATATVVATPSATTTPVATTTATQSTPSPTATSTPVATATASPTAVATSTTTVTSTPGANASLTATATPTATPLASATGTVTATPVATTTATPTLTATATVIATDTPTATPTAAPTVTLTASITPSATATATPVPTATLSPVATLTLTATPSPQPTGGACGAAGDADGDHVCDPDDDCPTVFNPDQADLDGDGQGNACDSTDADLVLRRGRVRDGKSGEGEIIAKGDLVVGPDAPFDPAQGLEVEIVDTVTLDQTFDFTAADCRTLKSGRVTCATPDGKSMARFDPLQAKPGHIRFSLHFKSLTLTEPFAPALLVRVTTDPGHAITGIDRIGTLDKCRVTAKALLCVAKQ